MTLFGIAIHQNRVLKWVFYIALAYFSYLMILITLQYIPIDFDVAFLRIKQQEIQWTYYQIAFFTHVYSSIFTLLLGFLQFSSTIRRTFPLMHRIAGKIYVGLIVLLAGPSGLVMGYHANGGFFSQLSFCILSLLWMYFSGQAYLYAKKKDWTQHSNYAIRSYALTLSAISLRLFKWIIVTIWALPPMDTYQIVAWLGWVANVVIAEMMIRYRYTSNP